MERNLLNEINAAMQRRMTENKILTTLYNRYVALNDMVDYWLDSPVITTDLKLFISAAHGERKRIRARLPECWK